MNGLTRLSVYPVTALTTLSRREKMALLEQREVLCTALPAKNRRASAGRRAGAKNGDGA